MSNQFSFWQNALAGNNVEIDANEPQSGIYYIRQGKDAPRKPVWIWLRGDKMAAAVGKKNEVDAYEIWTWVADKPCPKYAAEYWLEHGKFPGEVETAGIGDNSGDLSLKEQLADYMETAKAWFAKATIDTQEACDTAANYAAELIKLKGRVDKERDAKVRPHLDAQRDINSEYKPAIDAADKLAKDIKKASTAYLVAEKKRQEEEARRKFLEEQKRAEEERQRIEAERAKKMEEDPIAALTDPEPELPVEPKAPEPVKVAAGGQRGRKMHLRKKTIYAVEDYGKALEFAKDDPKVKAAVESVCFAAAKTGASVPGVTVSEVEEAA